MASPESLTANIQVQQNTTTVELIGPLNEFAQLPEFKVTQKVHVDLGKVTLLNSIGARAWCNWVDRFRPPTEVILERCPFLFVKNFNTVNGFLTPNMRVVSFFIPFYSHESGESRDFLAVRGIHFDTGPRIGKMELRDTKGNLMEPDIVPHTYFAFLKA